jgi:hypothetical protein
MKHLGFGGHGLVILMTLRIVLVFDGFFYYHFEPHQNMRNSFFIFGF